MSEELSPLIDAYRFCPVCGSNAFVRASPGKCCGECGHREFNNPVAAAGALICDPAGRLLFVRRAVDPAKGKLGIPGGFLDAGESLEAAARREVREETGLEIIKLEYLTSQSNQYLYGGHHRVTVDVIFVGTTESWDVSVDSAEASGFEFIAPGEIDPAELAFDSVRAAVQAYRNRVS